MKQILIITTLLFCCFTASFAGDKFPPVKKNAAKMNMLSPIWGTVSFSYQYLINPRKSVQIGAAYMDWDDWDDNPKANNYIKGLHLTAEYRINFTGYGLNGLYAGPVLRYMNYSRWLDHEVYLTQNWLMRRNVAVKETDHYQSIGVGVQLGYQAIIKNRVTFDFFAGPINHVLIKSDRKMETSSPLNAGEQIYLQGDLLSNNISNGFIRGLGFRAGFTIGLAF